MFYSFIHSAKKKKKKKKRGGKLKIHKWTNQPVIYLLNTRDTLPHYILHYKPFFLVFGFRFLYFKKILRQHINHNNGQILLVINYKNNNNNNVLNRKDKIKKSYNNNNKQNKQGKLYTKSTIRTLETHVVGH